MFWKKILLLLLIVHTAILARGKRRVHKRDAVDPLLSEIFKSTHSEVKPNPVKDTRPDRSIDPNEELEALLTGFQNRNKHLFPQNSPAKRESGLEPGYNLLQNNADQLMTLNAQGSPVNTRDVIPRPQDDNLMLGAQIPAATEAQLIDDPNQNFMEQTKKLQQQQEMLNGIAAASLVEPQTDAQDPHEIQGRNIIPGRPNQIKNDWANQPGVSIYLHPDKKSTIPIPVKTQASAVANPGSFPVQMRRMSPNMKFGAVVPHHVEFGETVESVLSKPEDTLAKKSQIPHPEVVQASEAKKSDVQKGNSNTQQEASSKKEENPSTAEKKDFLQQPLTAQQFPQQQPAFQTTSQFAATQSAAAFATAAMPATPNVPVIPGQKCEDQYNQCPDFAKNEYCTKYPEQMSIQCRKSCKFCIAPVAPAVPVLDSKQQIVPAAVNVTKPSDDDSSGSGSGDSSGSGDDTNDVTQRKSDVKKTTKPSEMYLPELGSGSGSGSGSGDELSSGSEATIVKQLASAQNIVSGPGQQATATKTESSKKSHVPLMKKVLLSSKSSDVVKKSSIPQRPVSPLTAMDTENVSDDDDDSSASGSGSGSGDSDDDVVQEAVAKSTISVPLKPSIKVAKKPENSVAKKPKIKAAKNPKKVAAKKKKKSAAKKNKKSAAKKNKKSSIPAAPAAPAAPKLTSAYPRIDLRKIASALAHYEEAALTLAGEYPHIADQDNDVMTRSQIPRPGSQPLSPFNKLRQNIQIAKLVTQDSGKRYEIPKYLLVGDQITEKDGIASRSSIPSADSVESVASRFAVPGVKPSLQEFYAETGKPVFDTDAAKRMRIAKKKKKIQKPVDPFEYLRNMPSGASMEPIVDPHAKSSVRESVSYPVYLMKVMPGSHKYVAAAPRSKVVPHPKKTEAKVAPDASKKHNAPLPPLRPAAPVLPQLPPQSEFEFAAPSAPYAQPQAKIAPHPQTQIELGPPMFHSAPEVDNINNVEQSPMPQNAMENQAYAVQQPQQEPAPENLKQSPPSLRTKMLSAFFQNKKSNEPEGSGSGMGEETNADTRSHISYDVSGPEQTQSLTGNTLSLQKLLSSEEGPGPESQRANQNAQHFYEAAPTRESNYLQAPKSDYLQSNLDALTPENAAAATQSAFSMQSGLSAGSPGARFTMSKTQETKWVKPDVGSELASILPETTSAAETRTIATQAPAQSFRPFVPSQSIVAAQAPLSNFHSGAVLQGLTTATGGLAPDTRAFKSSSSEDSNLSLQPEKDHQVSGTARNILPTAPSAPTKSSPIDTKSDIFKTTESAEKKMQVGDSLYEDFIEPKKLAKANIEPKPSVKQTDKPASVSRFIEAESQQSTGPSPAESPFSRSGPAQIRNNPGGLIDNIKPAEPISSRSNTQQNTNTGYNWQQYMPFGGGAWETRSNAPKTTVAASRNFNVETTLNSMPMIAAKPSEYALRKSSIGTPEFEAGLGLSPTVNSAALIQEPSQSSLNNANIDALQRQSIMSITSSGSRMSWQDTNGLARSGILSDNAKKGDSTASPKPTKKPAEPNTEVGIPQVAGNTGAGNTDGRSAATVNSIPMPLTNYEARLRSGPPAVASQIPQRKFQPAQVPSPSTTTSNVHKKNLIKHQPDLDCGDGWEGASGDFGTFCYKKMSVKTVFDDAQAECKGMNSHVFSILNPYENRYLQDNFHEKLWIGYRDKGMDGFWNWTDGSKGIYTNWAPEADDDNGQRRDCVMLQSDEGKWKDMPCGSTLPFLCKLKQGKCPKTWKKLNLNSVSGCYHMFQEQKNWEEAEQECENNDAHLVSILSEEEQTMIYQVYSSRNYWIGFNDKDSEGDWEWSDRSTSSFTNWDDNSPNNGGVSCAAFSAGGKWHDEPCMEKLPFICKRKGPKGEKVLGIDDEGFLKPVSRLLDKDEAARNEQISKGGPRPVVPSQYWPLLKNTKSGLSGNRPIAVHGDISNVYGGISLAGQNQYMDGGDFHGKCISDPDKCSKGLSVALQVFFEDEVRRYQKPHPVLDTSGGSKGFTIYIQNNKMHYKVITSEKVWELATDITTNRWEEIVMTWHNYKGITVFINGAFKDSSERGKNTGILREDATPRLLIGRRATDLKPFTHTKMAIASLAVFSKQLSIEDVTYAFTYDDTVVANYRWLMPHLVGQTIPSASEIVVRKDIGDMDGGLAIDGSKGWLEINDYDPCLKNPSECHHGFAVSFKLKLDQAVRDYKTAKYIIDSGGHKDGMKGISVYILNDNLYFQVIMSPEEDIMIWTVRTPIYTVRWQRVVMTWRLDKGLWVYTDGAFRGLTKTPKTLPTVFKNEPEGLVIGRKTVGPDFDGAEFGIGSFAIFSRFLSRQDTEHVFAVKDNPFPGLIREVWQNTPGSTMAQLRSNPDYPNNPSSIEVIENFDAPFDIERDYGSKLKGYFVAPETGNYTFYMSCSKSCELHFSGDEDTKNKSKLIEMNKATWHNQWNKFKNQSSPEIFMIAGKYYYLEAVQKGEESSDSLSVGVRMPSGRYQRPINKENLQWRLQGNPFAGVVREVWYEVPGYQVSDLTSDPNFPNNPSSTEIIDKFDAPFNIDDNYGSRLSGYFRAPETGDYRFYLAGDSTGELWISSDESESNLVKVVTLNGWTDHNQWLKFPEQRSDKIFLMAGKHYYIRAYQKADKLGDCVSVAVELPSGHFEGPIKKKHLSWKLPGGKVGPGPNDLSEALPKPVGLFPFNEASLREIVSGENGLIIHNIDLTTGPDGVKDSAFEFKGKQDSYLEIPNDGKLDTKNSITMLANIYPTGDDGPIINYKKNGWGVHMWQFDKTMLFVRFVSRDDGMATQPLATRVLQLDKWNQVGASYDNNTGVSQLWHDGKMVKSRNIGQIDLSTQHPIRVGARDNDDRFFKGKVACIQIYDKALTEQQIGDLRRCPKKDGQQTDSLLALTQAGSGSELNSEDSYSMENRVGEDTEEELAGELEKMKANHCDPNPCRNSAKCVNDERKVDGYKCVCTSDFTGKHCQVSKPAAENPVVKRMNIPKYPKEISSESYSKEAKKAKVKTAEDEREDIFLLYQKLGCYKDDVNRRDLPNNVVLRSTTQEECVRACAMQDKMYAYFGLQNGKNCFCGKSYGKYGKADDKSCSKRCAGNENENCGGDTANQVFFFGLGSNYTVKTFTGDQFGAGTDAKIFVELIGERGSSDFRQLNPDLKRYEPGSVDAQTFILPDLGKLKKIRVLHDNSGTAPSWFLKHMTVTDEEGNVTDFPCDDWLSDTQSGGKLERELISKSDTPKPKAGHKA